MHFIFASTALLFLAGQVECMPPAARIIPRTPIEDSLIRLDTYVTHRSFRRAHPILNHEAYRVRNVVPTSIVADPSATALSLPANSAQPKNANTWNSQTDAACVKSLIAMNGKASNPSGMAVCYNVQSLNTTTGAFQADLRLYRVAPPEGSWAALKTQDINVGLSYDGASVAPSNAKKAKRAEEVFAWALAKGSRLDKFRLRRAATPPTKLQDMSFIGKVDNDQISQIADKYGSSKAQHDLCC